MLTVGNVIPSKDGMDRQLSRECWDSKVHQLGGRGIGRERER